MAVRFEVDSYVVVQSLFVKMLDTRRDAIDTNSLLHELFFIDRGRTEYCRLTMSFTR